jgi:hypothetical protein
MSVVNPSCTCVGDPQSDLTNFGLQHDPEDEPVAPPLDPEFFEFDLHKDDISREQLKGASPLSFSWPNAHAFQRAVI